MDLVLHVCDCVFWTDVMFALVWRKERNVCRAPVEPWKTVHMLRSTCATFKRHPGGSIDPPESIFLSATTEVASCTPSLGTASSCSTSKEPGRFKARYE